MVRTSVLLASLAPIIVAQDLFLSTDQLKKQWDSRPVAKLPNLIWILTDDQDQMLGGAFPTTSGSTPMPKTRRLMMEEGIHATNWYIHTPICSPSRSELMTGRYFHNIKQVGGAGYCAGMHVNYTYVNSNTFVRLLKEKAGYTTGLFGKYLNEMPTAAPPGFDAWLANGGGSYFAPEFIAQGIDGLPDGHVKFSPDPANYTTAVVGNQSIAWIKKVAKEGKPFMAYIAPKAAHEPFNPAPWYRDHWDPSWPETEPRPENWNCSMESRKHHHGNIATEPMISERAARMITGVFKNRWRTLMSVDDLIGDVIQTIDDLGLKDNTYIFYSSDHGFQLGQFNIPMDKRHVYEWDTKIHLLARGPGIKPGSRFRAPGTQVDIAPTLLGLAGLAAPRSMDGRSIAPFLLDATDEVNVPVATGFHLAELGDRDAYAASWRNEVFIEYYFCDFNNKCVVGCPSGDYPNKDSLCANLVDNSDCWCDKTESTSDCYETEAQSNNFIALRRMGDAQTGKGNLLYAEFQTGDLTSSAVNFDDVDFVEIYDGTEDPWQMRNLARDPSHPVAAEKAALHQRLHMWLNCAGSSCP